MKLINRKHIHFVVRIAITIFMLVVLGGNANATGDNNYSIYRDNITSINKLQCGPDNIYIYSETTKGADGEYYLYSQNVYIQHQVVSREGNYNKLYLVNKKYRIESNDRFDGKPNKFGMPIIQDEICTADCVKGKDRNYLLLGYIYGHYNFSGESEELIDLKGNIIASNVGDDKYYYRMLRRLKIKSPRDHDRNTIIIRYDKFQ